MLLFPVAADVGLLEADASADDWLSGSAKLNVFDVDVADAVVEADVVDTVVSSR